jgi:photosystem II stability/assembly factor-like uncharacterized protein
MFKNSREGWITTYVPADGVLVLYKTSDGGTTWVTQQVMTPSEYADALFYPCMPMFFSEKDGIIFAMSDIESNFDCVAFITHDGGETWSFQSKEDTDESLTWNCKMTNHRISEMEVTYGKEIWHSVDGVVWEN